MPEGTPWPISYSDSPANRSTDQYALLALSACLSGGFDPLFLGIRDAPGIVNLMSCVDGSLIARVDLTLMQVGRVQSCVRPVDAVS